MPEEMFGDSFESSHKQKKVVVVDVIKVGKRPVAKMTIYDGVVGQYEGPEVVAMWPHKDPNDTMIKVMKTVSDYSSFMEDQE